MATVYSKKSFDDAPVTCPACRWTGKGADTKIIDLYGVGSVKEIRCPQCDKKLGDLADPGTGAANTSADNFQLE